MLPVWQHLLFSEAGFHHLRPTSVDYRASLLLFALLTLLVTALFSGIHKTPVRLQPWLGSTILCGILVVPLNERMRLIENQFPMALLRTYFFRALPIILCLIGIATCRRYYWKLWRLILIGCPFTLLAVPSLVDGVAYTAAFPVGPAQLRLRGANGGVTQWGAQSNVFTDCRDLRGRSILETMQMQTLAVLPVWRKIMHADTLVNIEREALTTLTNAAFDLCFIHFPVPHLPAIVGTLSYTNLAPLFSDPKAYIGNLHRADALMGHCLRALESSPAGLRTTLIVSSDHPWRRSNP